VGGLEGISLKTTNTVIAAAVSVALGYAHAQDAQILDPVVVTASRIAEPQAQAAVLVEVISREQIEDSGAANITELLDQVSGGLLTRQYGRLGVDASFDLGYLGGVSAQRTLVLIDGVRINESDDATVRWGQLPLDAIEQVEIRKAGAGVLFGDRALGGVVNIITTRAKDSGSANLTLGSFGTRVLSLQKASRSHDTSWQVAAQQAKTDGYRDGAKQVLQSGQFGISRATPLGLIGLAMRLSEEEIDRPAAISLATFEENPRVGSLQSPGYFYAARRTGKSIDLTWQHEHVSGGETLSRFARDSSESTARFLSASFIGTPTTYDNQRNTLEVRRTERVLSGRIIGGLEYVDAESSSNRFQRAKVEQLSSAVYSSAEFPFRQSLLSAGLRRQLIENRFFNAPDSSKQVSKQSLTSWSLGALASAAAGQLRFNVQSSFAFPTADQLYTYSARWQDAFAPQDIFPGVQAMRSNEIQIAYAHRRISSQFQTGLRHLEIKGEIGEKLDCVGENISCNTNLYDTQRLIIFLESSGRMSPDLSWAFNADRIQSEINSGGFAGNKVPLVPNFVAKGTLSLKQARSRYRLVANHRSEMIQSGDNANGKFRIPRRLTMDAGYTYTWASEQRELSVWIRNFTDKQYFDFAAWDGFSSGVAPADGRSYELRLQQRF
jgi:iron complex outermembrane receptor protein